MKLLAEIRVVVVKAAARIALISAMLLAVIVAAAPTEAEVKVPEGGDEPHVSSLNPDFEAYLETPPDVWYGYVPPTLDLSHVQASLPSEVEPLALASRYDWRDQNKVTPVRNQNPCGTCWAFGTVAVMESAALIAEDVAYDFSEQSVSLCVDRSWTYLYDHSDDPCMAGGNSYKASDVFIKKGAVAETCSPYAPAALNCDGACVCDNCSPIKTVSGYRLVTNDGTQETIIKNALMNHGPLIASFYHDDAYEYDVPTWGTIYDYYPSPDRANHCISIVGWDDDVPHPNPSHSGTGAWIIKNSWGTAHGNDGFGYLAYDSSHTTEIAYLHYRDHDPDEQLLYWDEAGLTGYRGWQDTTWMASVFTAPEDGTLNHVEFWTVDSNLTYEIYVWGGRFGGQLAHQVGSTQELGYYSVPLDNPVSFTSGQEFTIGVKMSGYIPVESQIANYVAPTLQPNVSFYRHTQADSWMDLANQGENACLRARLSPGVPNRPPTIEGLPDLTIPVNGSRDNAIDLWAYASDPEDADHQLSFRISNAPVTAAGVSVDGRYVDVNPDGGWTGTIDVEVEVADTGGLVDTDMFKVAVKVIDYLHVVYLPLVMRRSTALEPTPVPDPTETPPELVNGDFEDGATGWIEYSAHGHDIIVTGFAGSVTARSGTWAAWLGGDDDEISYIQQQVTVPPGSPYLTYWHWIASDDICGYDYGGVVVDGSVVDEYDLCESESTGGWVRHVVNLGAYAGQSVSLQVRAETDSSDNSNLFVDDVSFQASALSAGGSSSQIDPRDAEPKSDATRGE